jgi:molecular chaperone HtpG
MERLLHRMGRGEEITDAKRILELNPDHPVVQGLQTLQSSNAADPRVENVARLLFDEAVIAEGSRIKDPAGFAKRINELLARQVAEVS